MMKPSNAAPAVLMVRPANFGPNPETAESNSFQNKAEATELEAIRRKAIVEFDAAVKTLRDSGAEVIVASDEFLPERRDAVFPNNWISFHESGDVYLYPMQALARRTERRVEVLDELRPKFRVGQVKDITASENDGRYLEGTGSLIFDYPHKIVYACRSIRTDEALAREQAGRLGFEPVIFNAVDQQGLPVYHTNVVMCVGSGYCVICLECVPEGDEKDLLKQMLTKTNHEIVDISYQQMVRFAGNMLEVQGAKGELLLVMSKTAFGSLTSSQKNILEKYAKLIPVEIPTIEKYGGGSARCMMAGVHLPWK